ncbi:hypothetical protein HUG17_6114 [Dermatophagoides farinae]|uniref:Uncharacterized protein n=1 Tax=Dermatophagoides farinae TaxID=6954 RepID=A0A9D4P515_DERFA|nr:hypothetical protein HUG17_6114 [Dermatophagoides farinae]
MDSSSQAEKRARLRRAKILTNSEDRMNQSTSSSTDSFQSQPHSCVSLISSPIHYKTLQQSQQFQRQQNSMLSMIFIWPLMYLMNVTLLLFVISCIGSYYSINFTTLFFTFESIHFVIGWLMNNNNNNNSYYSHNGNSQNRILNNRFTFGQFYKDFLLSIFCYIIIQATLMIKR